MSIVCFQRKPTRIRMVNDFGEGIAAILNMPEMKQSVHLKNLMPRSICMNKLHYIVKEGPPRNSLFL